jgi:hypothetical protein
MMMKKMGAIIIRDHLAGIEHPFCTICGRANCDGYGDGQNIPDHTPDMDSVEEGGSESVKCDICGNRIDQGVIRLRDVDINTDDANEIAGDFCYNCIRESIVAHMQTNRNELNFDIEQAISFYQNPPIEIPEEYHADSNIVAQGVIYQLEMLENAPLTREEWMLKIFEVVDGPSEEDLDYNFMEFVLQKWVFCENRLYNLTDIGKAEIFKVRGH